VTRRHDEARNAARDDGLTLVASGFDALEGPTVDDVGNLYFSEIKRGGVHRLTPDGRIEVVVPDRVGVGGICLHAEGGLIASGLDLTHFHDHRQRLLVDLSEVPARPGTAAIGFNDLHADRLGRVLVGVRRADGPGQLLRVSSEHEFEVIHGDLYPNGIALSPDGSAIYAVDMSRRRVLVLADSPSSFSTEAIGGLPDGLVTDEEGFVWIAFYRGGCIARFDPSGSLARLVEMPIDKPLSLCFGGPDRTDLYIVTGSSGTESGSIFVLPVEVPGTAVDIARL
jgi:sugar lactone lactonase YvrE